MRSSLRISSFALAVALVPAALWAQTSPQQPPAQGSSQQNPPAQPSAQGTQPQSAPAQQPAATPPTRTFTADGGLIFNIIKPDHTADFEMVIGKLKEALAKSPDPKRKAQAAGWKVFKAVEPFQGNVLYLFILDPAVKEADYTVSKILSEVLPNEVQDLWKKYAESYAAGQSLTNLQLIANMGSGAPAAGGK
jgi:hypothetical protein